MPQKHFYEFGPFRIDLGFSRLERGGGAIPLPPKAFDLLVLLARNTDRVMAKPELIDALWPNTFVDEANLTQHVYMLRKALGDQPSGRPYIDTVPRRGYRLAADVRTVTVDAHAPLGAAPPDAAAAAAPSFSRASASGSPSCTAASPILRTLPNGLAPSRCIA